MYSDLNNVSQHQSKLFDKAVQACMWGKNREGVKEGNRKGVTQQLSQVTDFLHFQKQGWDHLLIWTFH